MSDVQNLPVSQETRGAVGLACPTCETPLRIHALDRFFGSPLHVDVCDRCGGIWFDRRELRVATRRLIRGRSLLFPRSSEDKSGSEFPAALRRPRFCPRDRAPLAAFEFARASRVYLNRCSKCRGEWVDAENVLAISDYSRRQVERLKRCTLPRLFVDAYCRDQLAQYNAWQYLGGLVASLTGRVIPLIDENPRSRRPQVVPALIALNVAIFIWQFFVLQNPDGVVQALGTIPALHGQWSTLWRIFTSMFVHTGLVHLLGNMYFLWRFGDNVEEALGRLRFLVFYVACGIVADVAYVLVFPTSDMPAVGASGAISGILGAYLVLYPTARLKAVFSRYFFFELPAVSYLAGWFLYQLAMGTLLHAYGDAPGVAWFAHIGGFLTGVALAYLVVERPEKERPTVSQVSRVSP